METSLSLDQLRVFTAVVDHEGFAAAARVLNRTQSSVSYAVANLERMLESKLLERGGRGVTLTATGRAILPEARVLLAQAEQVCALATLHSRGVEARLAVAFDQLTPRVLLMAALAQWQAQFPSTLLHWRRTTLGETAALVQAGTVAIGITGKYGAVLDDLNCTPLTVLKMVCVCGREHPLAAMAAMDDEAVACHPQVIITDPTSRTRGQNFTVLRGRKWQVSDIVSKHDLIVNNLGWGWMPNHIIHDAVAEGTLVALKPPRTPAEEELPLYVVHPRSIPLGPAAVGLVAALCEAANAST